MPNDATPTAPPTRPHLETPVEPMPPALGQDEAGGASEAVDLGIVDSLAQLSFLVQAVLAKVAAEHGLSVIQLRLLGVLRDREPLMHELARHLGLDKSSMTGLVDRAERRDLVRRTVAPHDKRAFQVSLTAQGDELVRAAEAEVGRQMQALTADLTDVQRTQLSRLASMLVTAHTRI